MPVAVVVPVVRHAQVAPARPAPVAEQDRQRAVPRRERDGRGVAIAGGVGPQQAAVGARLAVRRQVVAERQRRQRVVALPRGAEGDRPRVATVEPERLVGSLEPAVAEPAEDHVLADAQHGEIDEAVAVDVERVGAGDRGQIGDRRRHGLEPQRPADGAVVAVQRGRRAAAGEEQLAATVVVAVERGHAAADEVLEVALVAVVDAAGLGDEVRARPQLRPPSPHADVVSISRAPIRTGPAVRT